MKQLTQKLHSKTGASMVLALLFLFFCLTVGTIVLTAASSNAGRLLRNRIDQANELAVQSAAFLLRDNLTHLKFEGQYLHTYVQVDSLKYEDTQDGKQPVTSTEKSESYSTLPVTLVGWDLKEFTALKEELAALFYSQESALGVAAPVSMRYEMTITSQTGALDVPPVEAVMTVQTGSAEQFTITVGLSLEDGSHPMTMYFQVDESTLLQTQTQEVVTVTTGEGDFAGSETTTTIKTTYTQTIQWLRPEITKGAPS